MASFSLLESRTQTVSTDFVVKVNAVTSTTRHLVILDPGVDKADLLIEGVKAGYDLEVLSSKRPGLAQISEILRRYHHLDTLHIVSHGRAGDYSWVLAG